MFGLLQTVLQRCYLRLRAGRREELPNQVCKYIFRLQITRSALNTQPSPRRQKNLMLQTWVNAHLKIDPSIWPPCDAFDLTRQTLDETDAGTAWKERVINQWCVNYYVCYTTLCFCAIYTMNIIKAGGFKHLEFEWVRGSSNAGMDLKKCSFKQTKPELTAFW